MTHVPVASDAPSTEAEARGDWAMRALGPGDIDFLDALYEACRLDEVVAWGFAIDAARLFLRGQSVTQRRAYAAQYPAAEHWALVVAGGRRGRLILDAAAPVWRIVDLAVLPVHREKGLGTWAVKEVQARAARAGAPVRLRVAASNPARPLYARLGFSVTHEDGEYVAMEWRAH